MRIFALTATALALSGCVVTTGPSPQSRPQTASVNTPPPVSQGQAERNFNRVVAHMEPIIERECRARISRRDCNFKILVDNRKGKPSNAYQTLDKNGRPVIIFTRALILSTRNEDELAFVLGHEAAHHIKNHIPRTKQRAVGGAIIGGLAAAVLGGNSAAINEAQRVGGAVGGRSFSKKYELEADSLGAIITYRSGYDPIRGAAYFSRMRDPGDRFLGSHPPNAKRIETVRRTVANIR